MASFEFVVDSPPYGLKVSEFEEAVVEPPFGAIRALFFEAASSWRPLLPSAIELIALLSICEPMEMLSSAPLFTCSPMAMLL